MPIKFQRRDCDARAIRGAAGRPAGSTKADSRGTEPQTARPTVKDQVMQILRHSKIAMTMEIYSKVTSEQTRDALRQLGDSLGWASDDQGE
jgi:hypothetical protein